MSGKRSNRSVAERFHDQELIQRTLAEAVAEAILQHKRAGNPICEWRNGRVVWIEPADIPDLTQKAAKRA
jgi:hypothetical protein